MIRFFEEVCGTMGTYGYGEMTVSLSYSKALEAGEYKTRDELYSDLFGAMHPMSKRAVVVVNGRATFVKQTDKGFEVLQACSEDIFFKENKIL